MRRKWLKRTAETLVLALIVAGVVWFAWPRPVPVDLASVKAGPMAVTVDDEAKTRVRHVYTVSAPIAGRVLRISPPRHIGDEVTADETVVAVMQPPPPSFIDVRSREELQAVVATTEAGVKLAEADVGRLEAALGFTRSELKRAEALSRTDTISVRALEKARFDVDTNVAALASAKAQLEVRRHDLHNARARLIEPSQVAPESNPRCCIQLRAPVSGRVLKINQESESVVQAGAPLIEIGDPLDLEIVAELLSTDAVQIKLGASVQIDGWGGPPIKGRVVRVDPAGFLKVSALGIEEQRVRTVIDFADPPSAWSRLGHDYRVIVHVTIWSAEDALTAPVSALFRRGDDWAVFAIKDGRARTTIVKIGRRNSRVAEVLAGISAGTQIVLHPSDRIKDGVAVSERQTH
jgi:HlyD family secretion protein